MALSLSLRLHVQAGELLWLLQSTRHLPSPCLQLKERPGPKLLQRRPLENFQRRSPQGQRLVVVLLPKEPNKPSQSLEGQQRR